MYLAIPFIWMFILVCLCQCDDSPGPGFFLKITKNIPRLGRRSERNNENFFTKNSRTIPRIGRRDEDNDLTEISNWLATTNTRPSTSIGKRMMMSDGGISAAAERELSVVQPVNSNTLIELLNKDAIPSENVKFVHWKDFDRALQSDMDLYMKVISIGRRPDQRLKDDLNLSTYLPVSFFGALNGRRQNLGENYYDKTNNELYAGKLQRDMLRYNEIE